MIQITQKGDFNIDFDISEAIKALDKATDLMVDLAKDKAPIAKEPYYEYGKNGKRVKRRPGRLKKSIKRTVRQKSFRVFADAGANGAPYAIYQEEGFRHWITGKVHPGHHFMEGAFDAVMAQLEAEMPEIADRCLVVKKSGGNSTVKYG